MRYVKRYYILEADKKTLRVFTKEEEQERYFKKFPKHIQYKMVKYSGIEAINLEGSDE